MKNKKIYLILLMLPALACYASNNDIARAKFSPARIDAPLLPTVAACKVTTGFEAGSLNMRAGPGTSFALVTILQEDDLITALDKPAVSGWLYVKSRSFEGWVNSKFIECEVKHE